MDKLTFEGILETALYVDDLDAAEAFYGSVLGLEKISRAGNRHIFFRCGPGVLLIFNPAETVKPPPAEGLQVPPHGTRGNGHMCLRVQKGELQAWEDKLKAADIAIEPKCFGHRARGPSISATPPETDWNEPRPAWGISTDTQRRCRRTAAG